MLLDSINGRTEDLLRTLVLDVILLRKYLLGRPLALALGSAVRIRRQRGRADSRGGRGRDGFWTALSLGATALSGSSAFVHRVAAHVL